MVNLSEHYFFPVCWSQVVHVAGPHLLRYECTWSIAIPLDRMFVHCKFPSFHTSPGLTASPLQVTLLTPHP